MSGGDPMGVSPQRLTTLRIIHFALLMGCAGFGIFAFLLREQGQVPPRPAGPPIVSYAGAGMAAMMAVLFFVVPAALVAAWRRRMASHPPRLRRAATVLTGARSRRSSSSGRSCWRGPSS